MDQRHYGHWRIPGVNHELEGNLIVDKEKHALFLELLIPAAEDGGPTIGVREGTKVTYIQGSLFGNMDIVLYDCTFSKVNGFIGDILQLVLCKYAFEELKVDNEDQLAFSNVSVLFSGMTEWTRLCHFKQVFGDNNSTSIEWHAEEPVQISTGDGLTLTLSPAISSHCGPYEKETGLSQAVLSCFEYDKPVPWTRILRDSKKLKYLCSYALRDYVQIEEMKYTSPYLPRDENESYPLQPQTVLLGTGEDDMGRPSVGAGYFSLFSLQEGIDNGAIKKWFDSFEVLEPVLDLYFSVLEGAVRTPAFQFITLVQALETFHARFITNDRKTAVSMAKNLEDSSAESPNPVSFLAKPGQERSRDVNLYTRLAYLSYDRGNYPWRFDDYLYDEGTYITKVVDSRNYYTHYSGNKEDKALKGDDLVKANSHLAELLQYHILKTLGFDDDFAYKKVFK